MELEGLAEPLGDSEGETLLLGDTELDGETLDEAELLGL